MACRFRKKTTHADETAMNGIHSSPSGSPKNRAWHAMLFTMGWLQLASSCFAQGGCDRDLGSADHGAAVRHRAVSRRSRFPRGSRRRSAAATRSRCMDSQPPARGGRARRHDQRDGLRRSVLRLLRQQAARSSAARTCRSTGCRRTSPSTSGWACASWASIRRACKARSTRRIPSGGGSRTNTTEIPQIDMKKFPHGGMLCLLGPYGDFFIDVLAEIVTQLPRRRRLQLRRPALRRRLLLPALPRELSHATPAPRFPTPT